MPPSSNCSIRACCGKPIAVGGGVVLAASYEAKASACAAACPGEGARAVPAAHLRRRALQRLPAPRRRGHRRSRRLHAAGGADLDRRGLRRRRRLHASLRRPGRDRGNDPPTRPGRARSSDLGRRGAHQASGQDRLAGRQAGRPGRGRSRDRARVPPRSAGRADVGRRSRHQGQARRPGDRHHRTTGAIRRAARSSACSATRVGEKLGCARLEPRSARNPTRTPRATPPAPSPRSGGNPLSSAVFIPSVAAPCRSGRLAAPRKGPRRPNRHRARPLRRHARSDEVDDARRTDLRDDDARRDRRGPGARGARRPSAGASHHAARRLRLASRQAVGTAARTAARTSRREASARHARGRRAVVGRSRRWTPSGSASAARRSATRPWRWIGDVRFRTPFESWQRRTSASTKADTRAPVPASAELPSTPRCR